MISAYYFNSNECSSKNTFFIVEHNVLKKDCSSRKGGAVMFGRNPMFPPFPPRHFIGPTFPGYRPPMLPPRPGGIGGLLARLFSRGQTTSPPYFGMSMPTMQSATNTMNLGNSLSNVLTSVQKTLGVVQQVTPIVQQYGPLVKNLPAMLKLFKELEPADSTETETKETISPATPTSINPTSNPSDKKVGTPENTIENHLPQPKLYI